MGDCVREGVDGSAVRFSRRRVAVGPRPFEQSSQDHHRLIERSFAVWRVGDHTVRPHQEVHSFAIGHLVGLVSAGLAALTYAAVSMTVSARAGQLYRQRFRQSGGISRERLKYPATPCLH